MRLAKLALAAGLGLVIAAPAAAQPPGGFGRGGVTVAGAIPQNTQLQEELKMDKEQVDKLTMALAKVREELRDDLAKMLDRNSTPEQRTEIQKRVAEANSKAVKEVLKPEQFKRLGQIENQLIGLNMYTKEDVVTSLKLTDEQKTKIRSIADDLQRDLRELGRNLDQESLQKRQSLQKEARESVQKLLTDEQKTVAKELTGEPFELRLTFGAGPGGRGGFGGGFGGFGTPGQIFSSAIQQQLRLSDEQKKELEVLQKEVDEKIGKMLTEDQKKQLKELQERRPGGFGGGGTGNRPGRQPKKD